MNRRLMHSMRKGLCLGLPLALYIACGASAGASQPGNAAGEWRYYGGDPGSKKYSSLTQINRSNVGKLKVLWRRPGVDPTYTDAEPDLNPIHNFRATPLMIDGVLYASDTVGLVEAFDPASGKTIWAQEPLEPGLKGLAGLSTRGVAYWSNGSKRRIIAVRGDYLESLIAETGKLDKTFGNGGKVDLSRGDKFAVLAAGGSAGPIVVGDVVVVGGSGGDDFGVRREGPSEDIRAFDVQSGALRWTFHVLPRKGEVGYDTWEDDSVTLSGGAGAWAPLSFDPELGYVYVGTGSPNNTWFAGFRPGQNLFGNSIFCLDAKTGQRVWHYQLVHHDLWDYDVAAAPVLGDIVVGRKKIKAVIVVPKTGLVFVFDRVTGKPVWPIEERPVPASTTPGEHAYPTQPFPTKPAPVDRMGISLDDLIDFTPELREEALKIVKSYVIGPAFTPPSVAAPGHTQGTINYPGAGGGVNWTGPTFDPETGHLYVSSFTDPWIGSLVRPPPLVEATTPYMHGPSLDVQDVMATCCDQFEIYGPDGLPLVKPPYGRITNINLNTGDTTWVVPNGDGPRDHPRLRHLKLPRLGQPGKAGSLLTKSLLFIGDGSPITSLSHGGGNKFRAYDKVSGQVVWETVVPGGTTGAPMTYMYKGKQYVLVAVGGRKEPAEWIAFGLP